MTWWDDERKVDDDKIAHPADCSQWQRIDEKHKEFSDDPRNVRFGLSTDGMNPFNERMSDHSTWPVILTITTSERGCVRRESTFSSLFLFLALNNQVLI